MADIITDKDELDKSLKVDFLSEIKGIACGLNNLQKIKGGEPLGGKSRAEDDFAIDDDDDFLS